ncbi:MAG: hypothetical protein ACREHC_05150 [Candidatus Levyibacteriota bacterium]
MKSDDDDGWPYSLFTHVALLFNTQQQLLSYNQFSPISLDHFIHRLTFWHLSPINFILLLIVAPYVGIICFFILFKTLLWALKAIFPYFWKKLADTPEQLVALEITVPADTNKSAFATQQLYLLLHRIARSSGFIARLRRQKRSISLEIRASKNKGIRYLIVVPKDTEELIKRNLYSFLPGIQIVSAEDYLSQAYESDFTIEELKFSKHFALPLMSQKALQENDPSTYLTGNMTQLTDAELITYQMIVSPVLPVTQKDVTNTINRLKQKIAKGQPVSPELSEAFLHKLQEVSGVSWLMLLLRIEYKLSKITLQALVSILSAFFDLKSVAVPEIPNSSFNGAALDPYEKEIQSAIKEKLDSHLFEVSMRLMAVSSDQVQREKRMQGLLYSFEQMTSPYQSFITKGRFFSKNKTQEFRFSKFNNRLLGTGSPFNKNPIVSSSEIADLYHFPYFQTTKTEDIEKVMSPDLPLPLALKNINNFDITFAKNTYGDTSFPIGLTDDERSRHMYIVGQTGSGKSTVLFHSAKDDIQCIVSLLPLIQFNIVCSVEAKVL